VKLDPPYDDASSERLVPDGPCTEGLWALFPGDAPGATPEEKKANAARRPELAKSFEVRRSMYRLRGRNQVTLKAHDAAAGVLPIEVLGTVDCTDSIGRIAIAWTEAKAGSPNPSAAKEGSELTQNMWLAAPVAFSLPIKSMSEAKTFQQTNALGMTARVVFTLGKGECEPPHQALSSGIYRSTQLRDSFQPHGTLEASRDGEMGCWRRPQALRRRLRATSTVASVVGCHSTSAPAGVRPTREGTTSSRL
jgi:hypothetical protein